MGLRVNTFNSTGVHWKIQFLGGALTKIQSIGGIAWNRRGGLDSLQVEGGLGKKEGVVVFKGVDTLMHTGRQQNIIEMPYY